MVKWLLDKKNRAHVEGGFISLIGFWLSPLSWWNDIFVNVPLALGLTYSTWFFFSLGHIYLSQLILIISFIIWYFITNVLGFILLHHGISSFLHNRKEVQSLVHSFVYSVFYVIVVVIIWYMISGTEDVKNLAASFFPTGNP